MERMQKAAIEVAIALEVRCLTLYRTLSSKVTDITIRRIFKLLAHTAAEHLESFCNLYQGSDHELIALLGGKAFMCGSVPAKLRIKTGFSSVLPAGQIPT